MSLNSQTDDNDMCAEHLVNALDVIDRDRLPFLNYLVEMALCEALELGAAPNSAEEIADTLARAREAVT